MFGQVNLSFILNKINTVIRIWIMAIITMGCYLIIIFFKIEIMQILM